jgi:glycosyltransferase involved in cell wall biosynthesis
MSTPLISVVIPTYNRAHLVCEAIDSVLRQTYRAVELIVVDDGSTDDTAGVLKRYETRIRTVRQNNAGPSVARNHGAALASGEFVAFLDSDDLWLDHKLERQVSVVERAGGYVPCCLANIMMCWKQRRATSFDIALLNPPLECGVWTNVAEVLSTRFLLTNQGVMIRREVFHKLGGFNERLRLLEDHEFALRLALEGPWAYLREPLVIWRETASGSLYQSAQTNEAEWRRRMVEVIADHVCSLEATGGDRTILTNLRRELKRNRRGLAVANIEARGSRAAMWLARVLNKCEQYRRAMFTRSPWFPKMAVKTVGEQTTLREG